VISRPRLLTVGLMIERHPSGFELAAFCVFDVSFLNIREHVVEWLIRKLGEPEKPKADKPEPKAERKAKGGAQTAKGAPAKRKAAKKATAAKNAPTAKKVAKAQETAAPREGSKTAQVVAMLQRKNGATLAEIMDKMGWQGHTVRGFMAGAMKKAGYQVESFKPEGGERTYRTSQ
jgi:hypothetical protein